MAALGSPALAQDSQREPAQGEARRDPDVDIVVRADRLAGQLDVDTAPIDELDAQDVVALGAGSIAEVLEAITPQTSSSGRGAGGRPVILVNGVRIGSFRELGSYPPEAIAKVEVFDEDVAQRYGYSADQRVVNIVLKPNFQSREVELEYKQPGLGGFSQSEVEGTYSRIDKANRLNINAEVDHRSSLSEGERGVIQTVGSLPTFAFDPDPADFRTLISDLDTVQLTTNWSTSFPDSGSSLGLNATYNYSEFKSLSGLDTVTLVAPDGSTAVRSLNRADPLENRSFSNSFSTSGSYSRGLGDFQLTATWDAGLTDRVSEIERRADTSALVAAAAAGRLAIDSPFLATSDAGFDTSESQTWNGTSQLTLRGSPLMLPAGEVSSTFNFGYNWTRIESDDTRTATATQLTRGDLSGGANFTLPITSRRENFGDAIGDVTVTGNIGFNHLSDFGTLYDWSAGINWSPFSRLDLRAAYKWREAAPGLSQLGDPIVQNFNVPVFDLARNETVLATVISGGNPNLRAETQKDWQFSANWQLPFGDSLFARADYSINRSSDVTRGFPLLTPAIEAAFPGRVTRAADGTLTQLDRRSVTFAGTRTERVSFGLFARGAIGKARPQGDGAGGGRPGGPPQASSDGSEAQPARGGGDRRAQFMAMRNMLCGEDGEAFLMRLVDALEQGTELENPPEGFDLEGARRMLGRFRQDDGTYDREAMKAFRTQFCERMGARGGEGGGPPPGMSDERRARFMALRERLCTDDGEAYLLKVIEAVEKGEVPEDMEGFDLEQAQRLFARFRNEDGTLDKERLAQFRTRICSAEMAEGPPQAGQGGPPRGGARRGGGGGGFGRFGGGGDGRARYFVSLNHTIELENEVQIAPGLPPLDQLAGEGLSATGVPRHNTRLEAGLFRDGSGIRLSGRYTGKAQVVGNGQVGSTDLFFGDLLAFDLRVFGDLGQLTGNDDGFLKNLRLTLRADNVFDQRQRVVDSNGDVPLAYQPFLIDPVGRYLGIELRKVF